MNMARRKGAVAALLATVTVVMIGIPVDGTARATGQVVQDRNRIVAAARRAGAMIRVSLPGQERLSMRPGAAPLSASADISPTETATVTPTTPLTTAVATPSATGVATPTVTATPTNTATPPPTSTPSPTPPKPTPSPTPRPPTATPVVPSVKLSAVEVDTLSNNNREKKVTTTSLGTTVRLRIIVTVTGFAPGARANVTATWQLGDKLTYRHDFALTNGRTAIYDDIVLPTRGLATGAYYFTGSIAYHGQVQHATTVLHVVGQGVAQRAERVHYAHLHLTVPQGWKIDFKKDAQGHAATGADSLIMFSPSNRAAVSVISVKLNATPSSADLAAFPAVVLRQEFNTVQGVKTVNFNSQIDGQDVFAAQANVTLTDSDPAPSQALAVVTNKVRQFYAFTELNLYKSAPSNELRAGLASIFGAKLD